MGRAFHNLDGFIRDLRAAKLAGDQRWYELAEEIGEALDAIDDAVDGAGSSDDEELADAEDEVESPHASVRQQVLPRTGGPVPRGGSINAPASLLDGLLDGLAGPEREAAVLEFDKLRRDAVAVAGGKRHQRTVRADGKVC